MMLLASPAPGPRSADKTGSYSRGIDNQRLILIGVLTYRCWSWDLVESFFVRTLSILEGTLLYFGHRGRLVIRR
jgi:hypothetical protein